MAFSFAATNRVIWCKRMLLAGRLIGYPCVKENLTVIIIATFIGIVITFPIVITFAFSSSSSLSISQMGRGV